MGCGDEKRSAEIIKKVPEGSVLGINLCKEMITFARNPHPPEQFPNHVFMQGDASELTFDSKFDIAFSNAAFHWIKDHKLVLKILWKSLKPGEILLAQFGGRG